MVADLLQRSASDQAAMVRAGEVRARELVEAALGAIERRNPGLNAFVTVCGERALAEADTVGRAIRVRCAGYRSGSRICCRPPKEY